MNFINLLAFSVVDWLHRLGGPGLVLLGIADNSLVPLPGSQDIFTILLVSTHRAWWPYYAFMATLGAVIGGFITYQLAEKGGEETLERKIGKERARRVYKKFEKRGFRAVVIGALLPPPLPIVPVLMAPGILHYPTKKFLGALALGRGLRYFAVAYLGHVYGNSIIGFLSRYEKPVLYALLALAVLGGIGALLYFKYYRPKRRREEKERGEPVEQFPIPGEGNQKLKQQQQGKKPDEASADGKPSAGKDAEEKRTA
jgi:membrane protein YqaA with SNARE-associated domain